MADTNGLPEPRTLFRSPPRAARNTPLSDTAQDVVAEAIAAQSTVVNVQSDGLGDRRRKLDRDQVSAYGPPHRSTTTQYM